MTMFRRRGLLLNTPHIVNESGSIVTFDSSYNKTPIKSLICNIEPIQEGSGDPSPENIRPISGRTEACVTRSGKNLAVKGYVNTTTIAGMLITPTENGIRITGTSTARRAIDLFTISPMSRHIPFKEGEKISFSCFINGDISMTENPFIGYYAGGQYGGNISQLGTVNNYKYTWAVTNRYALYADSYLRAYIYIPANVSIDFEIGLQIERGALATDYEPYKGNTYSVNWETEAGAVYGGSLDVVSGKLVVDRAIKEFANASVWGTINTSNIFRYSNVTPLPKTVPNTVAVNAISNELSVTRYRYEVMKENYPSLSVDETGRMYIAISNDISTKEDLSTWLMANPLQVCYEIAEPFEIQLTPQEVKTILGANNIWCDSGDVTAEYWKWGK